MKIPAAVTTGASNITRPNRLDGATPGVEKLADPGSGKAKGHATGGAADTFERATPSAVGALLGDRRAPRPGGGLPTLETLPGQEDAAAPPLTVDDVLPGAPGNPLQGMIDDIRQHFAGLAETVRQLYDNLLNPRDPVTGEPQRATTSSEHLIEEREKALQALQEQCEKAVAEVTKLDEQAAKDYVAALTATSAVLTESIVELDAKNQLRPSTPDR